MQKVPTAAMKKRCVYCSYWEPLPAVSLCQAEGRLQRQPDKRTSCPLNATSGFLSYKDHLAYPRELCP